MTRSRTQLDPGPISAHRQGGGGDRRRQGHWAGSAVALAEAGADVVVAARTLADLESVAERIKAAGRRQDGRARPFRPCGDSKSRPSRPRLVRPSRHCGQQSRRMDAEADSRGLRATRRAFRFNVSTAHALVRTAVPIMLEGGGGSIVNISSFAATIGARGMVAYATAKAACLTTRIRRRRTGYQGHG